MRKNKTRKQIKQYSFLNNNPRIETCSYKRLTKRTKFVDGFFSGYSKKAGFTKRYKRIYNKQFRKRSVEYSGKSFINKKDGDLAWTVT